MGFTRLENGLTIPDYSRLPGDAVNLLFERAVLYFNSESWGWCTPLWQSTAKCSMRDCRMCVMNAERIYGYPENVKADAFAKIAGARGFVITRIGFERFTSGNLAQKAVPRMEA